MTSSKTLTEWGVTSVVESTYATFVAPALTDGFLATETPDPVFDYIHDGNRGNNPSGGKLGGIGRAGRGGSLSIPTQMILPQAVYSASVKPNLDLWLRACGFESVLDATGGSEKYTYTPESSDFESVSIRSHKQGQQYDLAGAYGTFGIAADGPEVPIWTFDFQGIGVLPSDVTLPTITYINGANTPPKSLGAGLLSIGGFTTAILRSWEFTLNREMSARADDNSAAGHAGFTPGLRDVRLSVVIEAAALATYDPYAVSEAATPVALALVIGASQYDQYTITLPQAELIDVAESEDGSTAMWELEYAGRVSAIGLNDDVTFLAD